MCKVCLSICWSFFVRIQVHENFIFVLVMINIEKLSWENNISLHSGDKIKTHLQKKKKETACRKSFILDFPQILLL